MSKPSICGWRGRLKAGLWDGVDESCMGVQEQEQSLWQFEYHRLCLGPQDLIQQEEFRTEKNQKSIAAAIILLRSVIVSRLALRTTYHLVDLMDFSR